MALPGIPQNFYVQTGNQQNLASWSLVAGATSYVVQRSLDNITYTTIATLSGTPLATQYLDTAVTTGTQYWYKVAAVTGIFTSSYTTAQSAVPTQAGEMCLSMIRLAAMQRADRVGSNFVTLPEWNSYINQAMYELYDLLITVFQDQYVAPPIQFSTDGTALLYPLPDGTISFKDALNLNNTIVPPAFYKLLGVDLQVQNTNNGYVNVEHFNFANRNQFIYPNSSSTIYGVFNCRYRIMGNNIMFIPTPSANQGVRLWYIPRIKQLLQDTDTTVVGISGWSEYIIVRAAMYALDKEEADTSKLVTQLMALNKRIEDSAPNRDAGSPDTISDTRSTRGFFGGGEGSSGMGGF